MDTNFGDTYTAEDRLGVKTDWLLVIARAILLGSIFTLVVVSIGTFAIVNAQTAHLKKVEAFTPIHWTPLK